MAVNPIRDNNNKIVALQMSAEEIQAGLIAAPQALEAAQGAVTAAQGAVTAATTANTIASQAQLAAESVVKRANDGEFQGKDGEAILYYTVALQYPIGAPKIGEKYSAQTKYFSRPPKLNEVFQAIGTNVHYATFSILAKVDSIGQTVGYTLINAIPQTSLSFVEMISYTTELKPSTPNSTHEVYCSYFNRQPRVGEVVAYTGFEVSGFGINMRIDSYQYMAEIISIDVENDNATYKILSRASINGEKGANGASIYNIILEEVEE